MTNSLSYQSLIATKDLAPLIILTILALAKFMKVSSMPIYIFQQKHENVRRHRMIRVEKDVKLPQCYVMLDCIV